MIYKCRFTGKQIEEAVGAVLAGKAALVTNCPNCGAPIEAGGCPYCGTKFLKYHKQEETDDAP